MAGRPGRCHLRATQPQRPRSAQWSVASPTYIAEHGLPTSLTELSDHHCLGAVPDLTHSAWPFAIGGTIRAVPVTMRLKVNGLAMAHQAVHAGAGVAQLPAFAVKADVSAGRLVQLFEDHIPAVGGVNLVYLHAQRRAPKVRELVARARDRFPALFAHSR